MSKNGYSAIAVSAGRNRQRQSKKVGLANLNKLWGLEAIPNFLEPGLAVNWADSDLECESLIKEVVGVWALKWLACT